MCFYNIGTFVGNVGLMCFPQRNLLRGLSLKNDVFEVNELCKETGHHSLWSQVGSICVPGEKLVPFNTSVIKDLCIPKMA